MKIRGLVALLIALGGCASKPALRARELPQDCILDSNQTFTKYICDTNGDGRVDEMTLSPSFPSCPSGLYLRSNPGGQECGLYDETWKNQQRIFDGDDKR